MYSLISRLETERSEQADALGILYSRQQQPYVLALRGPSEEVSEVRERLLFLPGIRHVVEQTLPRPRAEHLS